MRRIVLAGALLLAPPAFASGHLPDAMVFAVVALPAVLALLAWAAALLALRGPAGVLRASVGVLGCLAAAAVTILLLAAFQVEGPTLVLLGGGLPGVVLIAHLVRLVSALAGRPRVAAASSGLRDRLRALWRHL